MKFTVLPKTKLGRWSVWLLVVFVFIIAVFQIMVAVGQRGGETFFDNIRLSTVAVVAAISGIFSLLIGLISIIKSKERSILVFVATMIGLFVLIFIIGELAFPH